MDFFSFDGVNYVMAILSIVAFALFAGMALVILNDSARKFFQKKGFPLLILTGVVFIAFEVAILMVPNQAYEQGVRDAIGRPDGYCPVFQLDANGDLILSEETGAAEKNEYKLVGRPVVAMSDGEIHLWLSNRNVFPDATHLCKLPLTARNAQFAQQATEAWDSLHGEPGSGEELRELREQAERNGQGQPGQGEGQGGQVPDIIVELPGQGQDGEQSGDEGNAEQRGDGQEGEGQPGEGDMPYDQQSQGSVTIRPPQSDAPSKGR